MLGLDLCSAADAWCAWYCLQMSTVAQNTSCTSHLRAPFMARMRARAGADSGTLLEAPVAAGEAVDASAAMTRSAQRHEHVCVLCESHTV